MAGNSLGRDKAQTSYPQPTKEASLDIWIPPRYWTPVAFVAGILIGTFAMYGTQNSKLEAVQTKQTAQDLTITAIQGTISASKLSADAADKGLATRVDNLEAKLDITHQEVTAARIVQTQKMIPGK